MAQIRSLQSAQASVSGTSAIVLDRLQRSAAIFETTAMPIPLSTAWQAATKPERRIRVFSRRPARAAFRRVFLAGLLLLGIYLVAERLA